MSEVLVSGVQSFATRGARHHREGGRTGHRHGGLAGRAEAAELPGWGPKDNKTDNNHAQA